MQGIPSDIYNQLSETLLRCGPFDSDEDLYRVFVDSRISAWRNLLPSARDRTGRVQAIIETLFDQYNNDQENALVLLLRVLGESRETEDACHNDLTRRADELITHLINRSPRQVNKATLFKLLRQIFENEEAVRSFSGMYFKDWNDSHIQGLSFIIQGLISYCERYGLLNDLVRIIKREYSSQYAKFRENLYTPTIKPEASLVINRGIVEIRLRGNVDLQNPNIDDFLDDFRKSLVHYFGLRLPEVQIMEIRTGSIIIKALLSESAIEKLQQTSTERLAREFGIARVEILDSILVRIDLRGVNLRGVDLSASNLRGADLREANLQDAFLSRINLRLADLRRTNLRGANLQGADLRGANMSEALLERANLVGANLHETVLEGANLRGTDLRLTNLQYLQLANTICDETTKTPFNQTS